MRIWLTMGLLLLVYLAFLAVLRSLGIGLGWLILVAVGLGFVQYFFSDRLVLISTGARVVERDEYPGLHAMVERLSTEAGIPMPRVAIMASPIPNAFATGRSPSHAVVAVTDSIQRLLAPRELEAVLAHEIAHVRNRDILTMTIASFVAMIASLIMNNAIFLSLGDRRDGGNPWMIAWIVAIVVWIVSSLLLSSLSRYREYAADRGSALITRDPDPDLSPPEDQPPYRGGTPGAPPGGGGCERVLHPARDGISPGRTLRHPPTAREADRGTREVQDGDRSGGSLPVEGWSLPPFRLFVFRYRTLWACLSIDGRQRDETPLTPAASMGGAGLGGGRRQLQHWRGIPPAGRTATPMANRAPGV